MPQLFYSATSRALGVSANTRACAGAQRKSTVRRRVCRPVERVFRSGSFNRSGTSCFGACHQGVVEQRNSSHLGHQPSHRRVSSRQHHAQARRTKYCRPRGESAGQSRWLVASELVFPDDNVPTQTAGGRSRSSISITAKLIRVTYLSMERTSHLSGCMLGGLICKKETWSRIK